MTHSATLVALRDQAAKNGKQGEAIEAYVAYVQDRLERLTPADVKGVRADVFEIWRQRYHGTTAPMPAPPPTAAPQDEPSSVPEDEPSDEAAPATTPHTPRTRQRRDPKPAPVHAVSPTSTSADNVVDHINLSQINTGSVIAAAAREAADIGAALHVGEGYARGKRTLLQTLTFGRAAIAWALGTVAVLLTRSLPVLIVPHITSATLSIYQVVSLAVVIAAVIVSGAPWLFFRWRDVKKAGAALTGGDVFAMLVLGGLATYAAAHVTISLLSMFGI